MVEHKLVPRNLEVPGVEDRVFRAPGGKTRTFFTDTRLNQMLLWEHELCVLWLGSNDIRDGIKSKDITSEVIEIVEAIEWECEAKVYVCLMEPRLNPRGINQADHKMVQNFFNNQLKGVVKISVICFNTCSY